MWAQFFKVRIRPGRENDARNVAREFEVASKNNGVGPTRVLEFVNQKDPQEHYTIAIFESEEKAREAESNPDHAALIAKFFSACEGQPEYADLLPFQEWSR